MVFLFSSLVWSLHRLPASIQKYIDCGTSSCNWSTSRTPNPPPCTSACSTGCCSYDYAHIGYFCVEALSILLFYCLHRILSPLYITLLRFYFQFLHFNRNHLFLPFFCQPTHILIIFDMAGRTHHRSL